jgi:hypothetical protein
MTGKSPQTISRRKYRNGGAIWPNPIPNEKKISYRRQLTQTTHQQTDKNGTVPGLHANLCQNTSAKTYSRKLIALAPVACPKTKKPPPPIGWGLRF